MSLRVRILMLFFAFSCFILSAEKAELFQTETDDSTIEASQTKLKELNNSLLAIVSTEASTQVASSIAKSIDSILAEGKITDTIILSDAYYAIGHYYLHNFRYNRAADLFSRSVYFRETKGMTDRRYALGLSNMSVALLREGDYSKAYKEGLKAIEARRNISAGDTSVLAGNYLNLSSILLELKKPEQAISMAETGLRIADVYPGNITTEVIADLYQVIGLSFYRTSEYTKSLAYCKEALRLYEQIGEVSNSSKLLILNTLAQDYRRLDDRGNAEKYFKIGLKVREGKGSQEKLFIYINYADMLASEGMIKAGEKMLEKGLEDVSEIYGNNSREYYMMLASRAEFVYRRTGNAALSLEIYDECYNYVRDHPWDVSMKDYLLERYIGILYEAGTYSKVVKMTDYLIDKYTGSAGSVNAGLGEEIFSEDDLNMLIIRYKALTALSDTSGDKNSITMAIETGRIIVALYDWQRLEMSEDESRNTLSSFSRDIYTGMIENYLKLYNLDHDHESLEGIFEFSERSKVAGFLASMREVNAAKLSLPEELVERENDIRKDIGLYKELIAAEQIRAIPDSQKIATWESVTFRLLRSRDSLVRLFEESYPLYYNLKFKNEVTSLNKINAVIGKNTNLISYVLTSDRLYIFISNKRHNEVIARDVDSSFFNSLTRFREMLSSVPSTTDVRKPFNDFMDLANELYGILLAPAVPYLKGDKIVISPDNILSYLPFETLITESFRSPELLYREAPFALKKYRFSYIYSVTLSSEMLKKSRSFSNKLIAFAPTYEGMELPDSILNAWPTLRGEIRSLPNAVLEAEDAVSQCGGRAYIGDEATEENYKRESAKYDIVHLAMHTLVDDERPAFSKMIFQTSADSTDDGMLSTYEVYNVPLKSMMVVLSSCNTGTGMLVSGEGILSLARGFLYAGSRSVVMSMWTVEDASASEVIKSFYKNMRSGQTKSTAMRNARLRFLHKADQERSHPYYWSALVIYGDDTALWFDRIKIYSALIVLFAVITFLIAAFYKGPRS